MEYLALSMLNLNETIRVDLIGACRRSTGGERGSGLSRTTVTRPRVEVNGVGVRGEGFSGFADARLNLSSHSIV
jgi:hypothetical protein